MLCATLPQLHRVQFSRSDTLSALLLYVSPQLVTCRAGCFPPKDVRASGKKIRKETVDWRTPMACPYRPPSRGFSLMMSESARLQPQPDGFFEIEHQVHVVNSLTAGSFQRIVDARDNEQFVAMLSK